MFYLLLSLLINTADAHPSNRGHHHPPPANYRNRPPPAASYHSHRPPPRPSAPVARIGFRFIWNGFVWMEVTVHYSRIVWVPGHYDRWGYWVPGHYRSV